MSPSVGFSRSRLESRKRRLKLVKMADQRVGPELFRRQVMAAEVPVVVLAIGYHDLPPEELGADALIGHFNELEAALARLEPGPRESN